ncbi:MAG: secondary thiamine-phosphate synthase enzyme YjbQ [Geothrix sp.]|uniref:secondary thiamine-phosphate synthase enzyme YjbQ n=1 Tax=Geothrix sp. TaxID=1962974 RepID=UPI003BB039F7
MKNHRKVLTLHVAGRTGFVNITEDVAAAVRESGIQEGLCLVNSMHITSSVFINDEESGLKQDYLRWLEQLAPFNAGNDPAQGGYLHNRTGEDNGDAHHKRQVMGREVVIAITEGHLDFGTWEQVFYGEFDGRRDKRILIKVIGE